MQESLFLVFGEGKLEQATPIASRCASHDVQAVRQPDLSEKDPRP